MPERQHRIRQAFDRVASRALAAAGRFKVDLGPLRDGGAEAAAAFEDVETVRAALSDGTVPLPDPAPTDGKHAALGTCELLNAADRYVTREKRASDPEGVALVAALAARLRTLSAPVEKEAVEPER
ncbi:hypothetical protein [Microbacterium sp. 77mftsu3.1]|uniref:hypothetical protein n=1 Tax=Microbacterium sp. 77mftsu3.1 TaxID=1761802 RepID=UPI000A924474|nr:hypothetical protein [Microbacterium sp. 77mftsu3.1]